MSVEELLREAARLPADQQLTLVHRLLLAGEPPASVDVDRAWDVEIRERIARYDAGGTTARPASAVLIAEDPLLWRECEGG